jgi:anti-sigma regulatory factor (Ser/Thr protein kinase)/N-acetylglutamate synthase-like GNAT family acetyltransferase
MLQNSKIIIQNDLNLIEPVILYLKNIAIKTGLNKKEINRISYALEDILQNSILYDFEKDSQQEIIIEFIHIASGLKIIISDHGIPRNPNFIEQKNIQDIISNISCNNDSQKDADEISSVSSFIIHKLLDSYVLLNHGKDGRSLQMLIYASEARISDNNYKLPTQSKIENEKFSTIRRALPEDAVAISRLFYKSYGYSYPFDLIYYPERLATAIRNKTIISTIALTDKNRIIGHIGLKEPYENSELTEWGMAISDPDFRGQGIMNKIIETIKEDSTLKIYKGIFAHSVTNHEFTQKVCASHNFSEVALLVGYADKKLSFKKIHKQLKQRESVFISDKLLVPFDNEEIFMPKHHQKIISKLYKGLGVTIKQKPSPCKNSPQKESQIQESVKSSINEAEIVIKKAGEDIIKTIENTTKKLCINRIDVIYIVLNLEDYQAVKSIEKFEKLGYIFSGIFPYYYHTHSFIMQYFNNLTFNYDLIKTHTSLAKDLKNYIQTHTLL